MPDDRAFYYSEKSGVMTEANTTTIQVAAAAFQDFQTGLATGDWSEFLQRLHPDFYFWFPAGPFQGMNYGQERAAAFFAIVRKLFPEGLQLEVLQITSNATNVVFEVRSRGVMLGQPYENQAAVAFEIRDGKVIGYREYLGVVFQLG